MTPEQYLALAEEHAAAERYPEATAYASLATAAATVAAMHATLPPPLHRGDHTPQRLEWCGQCYSPAKRYAAGPRGSAKPCQTCHPRKLENLRVRPCHYCGADLQKNSERQWVDAAGQVDCPEAPDPSVPSTATDEPDLNRDEEWAEFVKALAQQGDAFTATDFLSNLQQWGGLMPRTRYGTFPSAAQLEAWMKAREGKPLAEYVPKAGPDERGAIRWWADKAEDPTAILD
ncbi:hypothetical protein [Streptomyces radiopugnans]|uniref:Uncharacterized protein n=1 Tax=Streptomyces radiopugnans TaxID=403935 RepID=A0A1H9KBB8_9ACTN|nr:hypothetical protein [Streptomyces radiopugnans]SEQ96155.1 hypothetical protein SAMN05216481_12217 [Streptomyces radiopugnans]